MENEEVCVKTCKDCGGIVKTASKRKKYCPTCLARHRKEALERYYKKLDACKNRRKYTKKVQVVKDTKKKPPLLSISAVLRINKIYNEVNNTVKHYGEMVQIIENTKADRCVCCGDIIPEGRMVCPICESKVKNNGCK